MKRNIKIFIVGIMFTLCAVTMFITTSEASPAKDKYRTCKGTYHNYLVIETKDGNEWLLSDAQKKSNPYMKWDKRHKCYIPRFREGQKVTVKFDTKGTKTKLDDAIVWVK